MSYQTQTADYLKQVENYYERTQWWYNLFWSNKKSLGMHYGFSDRNTKSKDESLINQYKVVRELLSPAKGQKILDAGCGIGGASIWLAEKTEASFTGITLSQKQVRQATINAARRGVSNRVEFKQMNYFQTSFPDQSFDGIFAIESACYAYPLPIGLYKEFFRLLKPGGKVVISDGILLRKPTTSEESMYLNRFYDGWALAGGNTAEEIQDYLREAGFNSVTYFNKTEEVKDTVKRLHRLYLILIPIITLLRKIRIISETEVKNAIAVHDQKIIYDRGIFGYGTFVAVRP